MRRYPFAKTPEKCPGCDGPIVKQECKPCGAYFGRAKKVVPRKVQVLTGCCSKPSRWDAKFLDAFADRYGSKIGFVRFDERRSISSAARILGIAYKVAERILRHSGIPVAYEHDVGGRQILTFQYRDLCRIRERLAKGKNGRWILKEKKP